MMDGAAIVHELRSTGFAVLPGVIPPERVPQVRAELDPARGPAAAACEAAYALPHDDPLRYRSQISYCPLFARWLAHSPLLEAARAVFCDQHVRVAEVEFFRKSREGRTGTPSHRGYHTDWPHDPGSGAAVGAVSHPQPDVCMSLSTIWYLTDVSPVSGGTWTVPGSFRDRRNPRGPDSEMDDAAAIPGEHQVVASAGSVFVQDSRNWHSVPHNAAANARVCVIVRYAPAWMSVEFGQKHAVSYYGSNTAWLPRANWLALPPLVRELFRHRAEGEHDALQQRKLLRRSQDYADDHAAWLSKAQCLAAEAPLPLQGSPELTSELRGAGLLSEIWRRCHDIQHQGYCTVPCLSVSTTIAAFSVLEMPPPPRLTKNEEGSPPTAAVLTAASEVIARLACNKLLLGVARSLLDMHIRIAAAQQVGNMGGAGWGCAFPHVVGHAMGWVEAPFPPARMGLSVLAVTYTASLASAHGNGTHPDTAAEAAAIVEIAVGSQHAQQCPVASMCADGQHKSTTLSLQPGEMVVLDTRTWRRYRSCSECTLIEIVLCPWWISCEFSRNSGHSAKQGFGRQGHVCSKDLIVRGTQLAATTIQDWPKELQELVWHMSDEEDSWQTLKVAETERAQEYAKREHRQGTNSGVIAGGLATTRAGL